MFTGLPQAAKPWKSVGCSFLLQFSAVAALIAISMLPQRITVGKNTASQYIPLTAPLPEVRQPELSRIRPARVQAPPPKVLAKLSVPVLRPRPEPVIPPPPPTIQQEELVSVAPHVVRPEPPRVVQTGMFTTESAPKVAENFPQQKIQTGAFSTGSSATPTANLPVQKVQTGGFGDPNGVMPSRNPAAGAVQIAQLGGFDLPSGTGVGNGSGGASGARAVMASAGFGNGIATSRPGAREAAGPHAAGFGEARPAAESQPLKKAAIKEPDMVGVEILQKPAPEYTEEARRLHIEGEVLLDVVFAANGQLQVVRVIRGLGHGLDESAVRAAERVRFKPALREGKPVDSKATLHIVFQLA